MNARRIFPVSEMIKPVNAGPIALDPLSVMAYNYQLVFEIQKKKKRGGGY
jgi:hypothetical protein